MLLEFEFEFVKVVPVGNKLILLVRFKFSFSAFQEITERFGTAGCQMA